MCCCRALNAEVGISPGGGVKVSQVIATNKAGGAIHNQQFAMIEGIVARVKYVPQPAKSLVLQQVHLRRKDLEIVWHHQICKTVIDGVDLDSLSGFARKSLFKLLAYFIPFPDVGFQVDALLRGINGGEHSVVEITPIAINLENVLSDVFFLQV